MPVTVFVLLERTLNVLGLDVTVDFPNHLSPSYSVDMILGTYEDVFVRAPKSLEIVVHMNQLSLELFPLAVSILAPFDLNFHLQIASRTSVNETKKEQKVYY